MPKIAVLGAGIIGISQACVLQEKCPNYHVTVIADQFSPEVTSDVAAGWWCPYLVSDDKETLYRWGKATHDYILRYARSKDTQGTMETSGYIFHETRGERPFWADFVQNFHELTADEMLEKRQGLPHREQGWFFTSLCLEATKHIKYLTKKFVDRGGVLIKKKLNTVNDIGGDYDVVVNCTGLGARHLFGDKTVYPTRGQVIRVRCPQVKHFYDDGIIYCLQNSDCLILGGTSEANDWDLTVRPETARYIFEENAKRVPALWNAEIISHHVGLRPTRPSIRVETEYLTIRGKKTPVVHNYGHGGSGITLFYGCNLDAAELVKKELPNSRL